MGIINATHIRSNYHPKNDKNTHLGVENAQKARTKSNGYAQHSQKLKNITKDLDKGRVM